MRDRKALEHILDGIDGRGYAGYRQVAGEFDLGDCRLDIDHVQTDPYAPPSAVRVSVAGASADLPADLIGDRAGRVATADFLTRRFVSAARELAPSGAIRIGEPGQEVLERTSIRIEHRRVEARLSVQLPAAGRRIRGREAARILADIIPRLAAMCLRHSSIDTAALRAHGTLYRDQEHLRARLAGAGLVAFVADGAVLPRAAGDSDLPLIRGAIPFESPAALRVSFPLPSGTTVSGMGVRDGVTVIVGGGYHGKSTLLRALERGVYPHIAGDGREWVITRGDAVTVRAEDGRAVTGVDISPFIGDLPSGTDTRHFSTTNASGSTSQAANLVEAIGAGATALLIDEDTSATNFMIRDDRMRRLIPADREPITPFVDRVRPLFTERGVSTVLVAGGSGAFFDVADTVIALDAYRPRDVTAAAHAIAGRPAAPDTPPGTVIPSELPRIPTARSLRDGSKPARARGRSDIRRGDQDIDLAAVVQLVDPAQTAALARALDRLADMFDGRRPLAEAVDLLLSRIDADGLEVLSPRRGHPGDLARPRRHEIHAAVNRYRRLELAAPGDLA
ncbi:ABC-ATPase domain-containing protein [Tsukamurella soli]|uniref:ABC-ATPase domain-containing protein n=1 Tax=Tsukamurella soli TaxID=644556 RepID=A0ABP8K8E4_9ACTN